MAWLIYTLRGIGALLFVGVGLLTLISAAWSENAITMTAIGIATSVLGWVAWPRQPNAWRRDPPTERQIRYAEALGIEVPPSISKGDLSDLISQVAGR